MSRRSRRIARFIKQACTAYPNKSTFAAMSHYGAQMMQAAERTAREMQDAEAHITDLLRRAREPMDRDDIFTSVWLLPCWIETRDGGLWADVVDRDSRGFFGRSNPARAFDKEHYGVTWRCWAGVHPTDEQRKSAAWKGDC